MAREKAAITSEKVETVTPPTPEVPEPKPEPKKVPRPQIAVEETVSDTEKTPKVQEELPKPTLRPQLETEEVFLQFSEFTIAANGNEATQHVIEVTINAIVFEKAS